MNDKKMTLEQVRDEMRGMHAPLTTGGALERWADAIDAELKSRGEPVGCLTIGRFRGAGSMVNHDFDYYGDLPDGSYTVYTAPPAPKIDDAMVSNLAWWLAQRDGEDAGLHFYEDSAREMLEAALKDIP